MVNYKSDLYFDLHEISLELDNLLIQENYGGLFDRKNDQSYHLMRMAKAIKADPEDSIALHKKSISDETMKVDEEVNPVTGKKVEVLSFEEYFQKLNNYNYSA